MIPSLKFFISSIGLVVLFASCEKELSYENGGLITVGNVGGTAKYSLSGAPGGCTGAIVDGDYKAGAGLTANNTIEITVNVDSIGTYLVTTNTVNGISFSGSGTFTNTGVQTIILAGTGTPVAAGTFSYVPGSNGCSFAVTIEAATGNAVFTLGGSPASCTGFTAAGTYTAGTALIATNMVTFDVNVTTIGTYAISTAAVNGVTFTKTGSFSATGSQTITLQGAGTPTAAGDFTYAVVNGTNNCSFILTVVAAGPVAAGTIDCTTATLSGNYIQGVALIASNTVSIPVNVTTAGSYSITTNDNNGCSFSGSGVLATGNQTILLTGSGTPVNAGTIAFQVSLGASNCSFPIDFLPGTAATDFIRCTIDGVAKTYNNGAFAVDLAGSILISGDENTSGSSPIFSLNLNNSGGTVDVGDYALPSLTNLIRTCLPDFDIDGTGTSIWTGGLLGQPNGFQVTITSRTATRIQGTFSGSLYDNNGTGTNAKVVASGEFSVPF